MIETYGVINDRAPHIVADLCEIISYSKNQEFSRADLETVLSTHAGDGLRVDLKLDALETSAETNEVLQALSEEVFRHFHYRATAFGDYYPFSTDGDILIPITQATPHHNIYATLLAFSRLAMFSGSDRTRLAACFEDLCFAASTGLTGSWEVVHFGTGGRDRSHYGHKLKDALMTLSRVLRETPIEQEIYNLSDQNTGDAGIDIIIYREWRDPARAIPCYFAQCAAQKDNWPTKKFEPNPLNLEKFFSFFHKPGTIFFIPLCFRGVDGNWINLDGHQTILIDRQRLVELIEARIAQCDDQESVFQQIPRPLTLGCAVDV